MKSNSKSGLCVKQIIIAITILVIIGITLQFMTLKNNELIISSLNNKKINNEENVQEDVQVAQILREKANVTSRSSEERTISNENLEQTENKETTNTIKSAETENSNAVETTTTDNATENNTAVAAETANVPTVVYKSISEIKISKSMDLTQRCGISREDFISLLTNLKVDSSGFFETNAGTIYDLCEKYEINEIFLCGLIAAESGWNIASNHRNANNYISMMSGGKLIRYSSVSEGLEAATKLLHNKYLTAGGSCYNGKTLSAVQKRFCPNSSTWVGLVYGCMDQII